MKRVLPGTPQQAEQQQTQPPAPYTLLSCCICRGRRITWTLHLGFSTTLPDSLPECAASLA